MRRAQQRRPRAVVTTLALTLGLAATPGIAASASPAGADGTTVLSHQVLARLHKRTLVGPADQTKRLQFAVAIASPRAAEEAAFARAQQTPGSAVYHRFLTPEERAARFGVDNATLTRIEQQLTASGLRVGYAAPDGTYVLLDGTVGQAAATFKVDEQTYRGVNGRTFRANAQPPTVPAGVSAVFGLTSLETVRPAQTQCTAAGPCTGILSAEDLWSVYQQPAGNMGTGQRIAAFGDGDMNAPVAYLRRFEDFKHFKRVPVRRIPVDDDGTDTSGEGEWDLDVTASTGMAPDLAELDLYFGGAATIPSFFAALSAWENDPAGPAIGTASVGSCEDLLTAVGLTSSADPILQGLAEEGRTLFNSTGDTGGSCIAPQSSVNGVTNTAAPSVMYPAASPWVVAVGGTVLYTDGASPPSRTAEYAWSHTGGGSAQFHPAPSWQSDVTPIVGRCLAAADETTTGTGQQCRGLPDVTALSGDISVAVGGAVAQITGSSPIDGNGYQTGPTQADVNGGTSLATPLWAGMWARVVAAHPANCAAAGAPGPIGFAAPALYKVAKSAADASAFTDITEGSNGQYTAIPRNPADPTGWDYVSGLGTPNVNGLIAALDCGNTTPVASNPNLPEDRTEAPPAAGGCTNTGHIDDPTGDATVFGGVTPNDGPANDNALDLTAVDLVANADGITWKNHVVDLASDPSELAFENYFTYLGSGYDLVADNAAPTGPPTFQLVTVDSTGNFTTVISALPGSFDNATNTMSITLPYADFNAATHPATPLALGASLTALTTDADRSLDGLLSPADTATFGACPYLAAILPTTELPEVATPALLVVGAMLVIGCALVVRRRRGIAGV